MLQDLLQRQAERVLEWHELLAILSTFAQSDLGAERCRTLPLATELEVAEAHQQELTEMLHVLERPTPFPGVSFKDVEEVVVKTTKGAALEGRGR